MVKHLTKAGVRAKEKKARKAKLCADAKVLCLPSFRTTDLVCCRGTKPSWQETSRRYAAGLTGQASHRLVVLVQAAKHYTLAIGHDVNDHVLYSNRSACLSSLQ